MSGNYPFGVGPHNLPYQKDCPDDWRTSCMELTRKCECAEIRNMKQDEIERELHAEGNCDPWECPYCIDDEMEQKKRITRWEKQERDVIVKDLRKKGLLNGEDLYEEEIC